MYSENKIARFVLDEVHCAKNWGDDFRVAYKHLDRLKAKYPNVPILGLTATATVNVRKQLAIRLGLQKNFLIFQGSFNRPNLIMQVHKKNPVKNEYYLELFKLIKRYENETGLIYTFTRNNCEYLYHLISKAGINCYYYHAGMTSEER